MSTVRVLLTGGPGGGKTSALATLRDRLTRRGFQALVVPETASALLGNSGGYDVAWLGTPKHVKLQEIFMKYQMFQEETYNSIAALRPDKPAVVICDRGLLEGKLFCSDDEWAESLRRLETTEEDLLKRYDVVIHMTSIASGMEHLYDYGPGSSNPSRYHTPEQARDTDVKAQQLYARHPQVRVVSNFPDFAMKIETVLGYVFEILKSTASGAVGEWDRELVPAELPLADSWPVKYEVYEQLVTFLDGAMGESVRRRELVLSCAGEGAKPVKPESEVGTVQFEHRKEVKQEDRTCHTRQVLTPDAYHLLRERFSGCSIVEVKKRSTCFVWEGHHYELSSYSGLDGSDISEDWELRGVRVLDKPVSAPVPAFLQSGTNVGGQVLESTAATDSSVKADTTGTTEKKAKTAPRKLARHATAEAAMSAVVMKRPGVPDMAPSVDAPSLKRQRVSDAMSPATIAVTRAIVAHVSDPGSPNPLSPTTRRRPEPLGRSPQISRLAAVAVSAASPAIKPVQVEHPQIPPVTA